jgi:hypothetical protein
MGKEGGLVTLQSLLILKKAPEPSAFSQMSRLQSFYDQHIQVPHKVALESKIH